MPSAATAPATRRVHRIEVRPRPGAGDPRAVTLAREARALGIEPRRVRTARVYLIEAPLSPEQLERVRARLLEDPVVETATLGAAAPGADERTIEVHPLPGVMDPAAQTVASAIADLVGVAGDVLTGSRYDLAGVTPEQADVLARRLLANTVVHAIHTAPHHPDSLPRGRPAEFRVTRIPIRELDDAALERLSREAHLFLSLDEMRAIRAEYRTLGREPTDIELETLAQTWSEHCVHKTLKATIKYREETDGRRVGQTNIGWAGRPGHEVHEDGSVTIHNLLKSTVAAATHELIADGVDWTLSVFVDNAGVIAFDDDHAVCVKVETHNHPSAIEPYGGAATGIGGCIRDVIGTGLAAKPIASTDVFCVAHPDLVGVPAGCLPPRRVLTEVVRGVRDYGNRMGIPTVNGAVAFDDRYVGNPLVYCGCIGVMPRDKIRGHARPGDRIIALGGRTGRDGIHGATFSSAELTDTHADEFAHAVQIGNAIEEKRLLDAILRARDGVDADTSSRPLFTAITDCGAGGFSSAIGEMGEKLGAEVHIDRAPLKYAGLTYTEIWISEAQERMILAVPEANVPALQRICDEEQVELADLGRFGTPGRDLVLHYDGVEVGRLPMRFLHEGIPMPTREAVWGKRDEETKRRTDAAPASSDPGGDEGASSLRNSVSPSVANQPGIVEALLALLSHPNIASKHWIIRQYDHEVQGATVLKPLVGPLGRGPGDAAVIRPVADSNRGLAVACGLATGVGDPAIGGDPYEMALAAIDECVRNLVCVGADPNRIAILDNFCWPSCKKPENLASLVRAAEGCYDGAKAYRTPFVSGKDSLNNQFTIPGEDGSDGRTIEIPPTLLITGIGIVPDVNRCVTSDAKRPGNSLFYVFAEEFARPGFRGGLGGSLFARRFGVPAGESTEVPRVDLEGGPMVARLISEMMRRGYIAACHDCSDGGPLVAVAEMLIAGSTAERPLGATVLAGGLLCDTRYACFSEAPSAYIVEVHARHADAFANLLLRGELKPEIECNGLKFGTTDDSGVLEIREMSAEPGEVTSIPVEDLARAWRAPLDW